MARSYDWNAGRRNGIKAAVAFIHRYAAKMNDPSARAALNTCASSLGNGEKRRARGEIKGKIDRAIGLDWELSEETIKQLAEIDRHIVR